MFIKNAQSTSNTGIMNQNVASTSAKRDNGVVDDIDTTPLNN
jgi:hypothetical protein